MLGPVLWQYGAAALAGVSGINWYARTFIATTIVGGFLLSFTEPRAQIRIISEVELLPSAVHVVCLVAVAIPVTVFLLVSGSSNATSWIMKGKALKGAGLKLLRGS